MTARDELYAVMVSLGSETLLLPNAAVLEVLSVDRAQTSAGPDWLAGTLAYQGRQLSVVRFEVLNGGTAFPDSRRTRIAVVHAISDRVRAGYYGLVCQGHPHLVTLNRKAVRADALHATDRPELVLARVGIANTSALIPDLEALEEQLGQRDTLAAA